MLLSSPLDVAHTNSIGHGTAGLLVTRVSLQGQKKSCNFGENGMGTGHDDVRWYGKFSGGSGLGRFSM